MTVPTGFIELEVPVPQPPAQKEQSEIRCTRVDNIAEIKPSHVTPDCCRLQLVFGSRAEQVYVSGTYTEFKNQIARSQELLELGSQASELSEPEIRALDLLAEQQQTTPAQVLRWALEHYARATFHRLDFERFYPVAPFVAHSYPPDPVPE